jgi:NAD(P)-dependent dehydrogenase (short-subunit alcohol dehydrogenase family)
MVRQNVGPQQLLALVNGFPIARICEPEEVAEVIYFLISDNSNYITGAAIDINGGDLMI